MEYVGGGELLELVEKSGPFAEEKAKTIFKQIVSAIAYCHSNKLIHRDMKLENILMQEVDTIKVFIWWGWGVTFIIKIIDFGIAGMASHFSVDNVDAGSLRYMAPELLTG